MRRAFPMGKPCRKNGLSCWGAVFSVTAGFFWEKYEIFARFSGTS